MNKKIALLVTIASLTMTSVAQQTVTYEMIQNCVNPKKELEKSYEAYTASDNHTYRIGDDIIVGIPSSNKRFTFIQSELGQAGAFLIGTDPRLSAEHAGKKMKIKKISVDGSKKKGAYITIRAYLQGVGGIDIQFENALQNGEIKSFGMTSDAAMEQLKKEKDKLDMNLITEEEYNKRKEELIKYIK